jgi:hypothetical protein
LSAFRLGSNNLKRRGNFRNRNKIVLIITNGEKTEPIYFENFKKKNSSIKTEIRKESGSDPITLIKFAIRIKDAYDTDRIYCVYDVDSSSDELLRKAKIMADRNSMTACVSNPCFELWFLLHYVNYTSGFSCYEDLKSKLLDYMPDYEKTLDVYARLQPLQQTAISNAKRLMEYHAEEGNNSSIKKCNPSTQVHELVEYLINISA